MKQIMVIALMAPMFLLAQQPNKVVYKAKQIKNLIIQNYGQQNKSVISDKVLGVNVEIIVDTIFKQYKIYFDDENYKRTYVTFSFAADLDKSWNKSYRPQVRTYKMESQERYCTLYDYLDSFLYMLEIKFDDELPNNCVLIWDIVDVVKQ